MRHLLFFIQMMLDMVEWTAYLDQQNYSVEGQDHNKCCYVLFETKQAEDEEDFLERSLSIPRNKQVKVIFFIGLTM